LIIYGNGKLRGGTVESYNDHRIAMSAFCASAICENDIILNDAKAIDKSYPSFMEDFEKIGGVFSVI
jgi:3-phosphoshikimate 1-carboxyvinyltransferase